MARLKSASPLILMMLVVQTGLARGQDSRPPQGLQQDLPADVTAYAIRRTGCNHWGGEEPYDAARKREIAAAIDKLRCQAIDRDERTLRQRYLNVPQVQKAIDRASDE